jgi:Predicted acetyltransferases and hydrolases with the alpha/beta hydrolase fold
MQRTVMLLHGIFDSGRVFATLQQLLHKHGFRTLAPDLVPNDGSASMATLAEQVRRIIEQERRETEWLGLIGFSMGGIVARYYLQNLGGYRHVKRVVTISSPHRGSALAYLASGKGAQELRPNSPLLQELSEDEQQLLPLKPLSLWTPLDLMIVPAKNSIWKIAKNVAFNVVAHRLMLSSKAVHQTILKSLLDDEDGKHAAC